VLPVIAPETGLQTIQAANWKVAIQKTPIQGVSTPTGEASVEPVVSG
jgi:hypothetical protein